MSRFRDCLSVITTSYCEAHVFPIKLRPLRYQKAVIELTITAFSILLNVVDTNPELVDVLKSRTIGFTNCTTVRKFSSDSGHGCSVCHPFRSISVVVVVIGFNNHYIPRFGFHG